MFRGRYDSVVASRTTAFHGYHETLDEILQLGYRLFIVTNKRIKAARAILERLGGAERFSDVSSPDAHNPPLEGKTAVLADVIARYSVDEASSFFVGDSGDDATAAHANHVPFVAALYGYGSLSSQDSRCVSAIGALTELPAILAAAAKSRGSIAFPAIPA